MLTETVKELQAAKAKLAELEAAAAKQSAAMLAGLPEEYGFDSVDSFIAALKSAARSGGGRRGRPAKKAVVKAAAPKAGKARKRAKITPEIKQQVKDLVGKDESGAAIAKALGISLPSVQNIKKELGLVKSRK